VQVKPKACQPLKSDFDSDEAYMTNSTVQTAPQVQKFGNINTEGIT
jgi:hypothetical protein